MNTTGDARILEVDDLVVRYPVARGLVGTLARRPRQQVHAVEGVSFTLRRGEMLALVGESGCGKTTTAQAVLRLVDADAGTITLVVQVDSRVRGRLSVPADIGEDDVENEGHGED